MIFNERLKSLREDKGFTQQHLSEVLNLSSSAVSHYENGTREPTIETLIRMADVLNVSVDYLVGNTDTNILPDEMNKLYCKGVSPMRTNLKLKQTGVRPFLGKETIARNKDKIAFGAIFSL